MKHLVNSANVGIGFRTRVPFFAENHCKVNQLFDIYSIFDSQYIVCFQEKAFHPYRLAVLNKGLSLLAMQAFFIGKFRASSCCSK